MDIRFESIKKENRVKVIELWNNNIGLTFPMTDRLFNFNIDADENFNEDSFIGAFYHNELIGCILYKQEVADKGLVKVELHKGNISFIVVDYKYRNRGIGNKLLSMCEEDLFNKGVKEIHVGRDTFHFMPGVPMELVKEKKFLKKRNYTESHNSYDFICDIGKTNLEESMKLKGLKINKDSRYETAILKKEDISKFMDFFERTFPGRWYGEMAIFLNKGMECRDVVVIKDKCEDIIVGFSHIYDKNSKVIGPGIYWSELLGEEYGGLGPIGVDKSYRKKALGLTILYEALKILQNRGVRNMVIDWTELFDFYGIFNFIPWKGYTHMSKRID